MDAVDREILAVKQLGEIIGYDKMMQLASALWMKEAEEKGLSRKEVLLPIPADLLDYNVLGRVAPTHIYYGNLVRSRT